jgi:hypothetical protein
MHYVATDDFCKLKTIYSISINFSKFRFRFIVVALYYNWAKKIEVKAYDRTEPT